MIHPREWITLISFRHVSVISHLFSAAYKLTRGPLHVSLGIQVKNCLIRNAVIPITNNSLLTSKIRDRRGMQRGIKKSWAASAKFAFNNDRPILALFDIQADTTPHDYKQSMNRQWQIVSNARRPTLNFTDAAKRTEKLVIFTEAAGIDFATDCSTHHH